MIRIELDDFSIDVPIEKRMTVQQFLAIADRLERISKRARTSASHGEWGARSPAEAVYDTHHTMEHGGFDAPHHEAPHTEPPSTATHHQESMGEFRFEQETMKRTEYILDRVSRQLEGLGEMQQRLERLEHHLERR